MKRLGLALAMAVIVAGCGPMLEHAILSRSTTPPPLHHLRPSDVAVVTGSGPVQIARYKMTGFRITLAQNNSVSYEVGSRKGSKTYFEPLSWFFAGIDKAVPLAKMKTRACSDRNFQTPTFLRVGEDVSPDLRCVDFEQYRDVARIFNIVGNLNACLLKYQSDEHFGLNPDCNDIGGAAEGRDQGKG